MSASPAVNPWSPGAGGPDIQVPFMPGLQMTDSSGASPDPRVQKPKPQFTLIATIGSEDGLSGIIRSGDGEVTIVEVGDTLEEDFTVTKLDASHAILTDGRDTIIAETPRP